MSYGQLLTLRFGKGLFVQVRESLFELCKQIDRNDRMESCGDVVNIVNLFWKLLFSQS